MTHPGQLLKQNKIYAGKELGQNFLSDPSTARMIVDKTGVAGSSQVLEIGPGLGALTIPLARAADHVVSVEKDRRLIPLLEQELEKEEVSNVTVINKDFLKFDISQAAQGKKLVVIGNLPYNISSQILFKLVQEREHVDKAFLMFQKELAKRIVSPPGSRDYSRLSAVVQYAAYVSHTIDIGPASFFPRPDVDSTVLEFDFFDSSGIEYEKEVLLFDVIKAAFSKRRKSLKNSMTGGELKYKKPMVVQALEAAGIDPTRRAETLSVEEFKMLSESVWELTRSTDEKK